VINTTVIITAEIAAFFTRNFSAIPRGVTGFASDETHHHEWYMLCVCEGGREGQNKN
jgi:hypothetical protein